MSRPLLLSSFVGVLLASPALRAEPSARDRAAAEAIFRQATALSDEGRFAEACEKLAASQALDPALGTLLHLADCYDRIGRTASAWALFREVEDKSRRASQPDRERIAKERAEALEGKLSKLELQLPPGRLVAGLEVRLAGSTIPTASLNTSLPVDPGPLQIDVAAPGKKPARLELTIEPGPSQQSLELPELADAPVPATPAAITPGQAAAPAESSAQKGVGYVLAAVGLVGIGVGGYFGYRAHSQSSDSKAHCRASDPNACTRQGFDMRQSAQDSAKLATILSASGAALSVTGLTLVLTAPRSRRESAGWHLEWQGAW